MAVAVQTALQNLLLRAQQIRGDLNCVKDVKFPISYSLQSVDLKPIEQDPGLVSLTLRHSGEIRVVHGNKDVHSAVEKAFEGRGDNKGQAEQQPGKESTNESSVVTAGEQSKSGVWIFRGENGIFEGKNGIECCCELLENLVRSGWEVIASGKFTTTPDFEIVTWMLKKSVTPLDNAEVAAVAFTDDKRKIRVLSRNPQVQVNNVVHRALEAVCPSSKKETDEQEEKDEAEEDKDKDKDQKTVSKQNKDDPDCPSDFDIKESGGDCSQSRICLEIAHLLFCRQWKLIASLPFGDDEAVFYCSDGRILPALGQAAFAMLEVEKPDSIRLHRVGEDVEKGIKEILGEFSPEVKENEGSQSKELKMKTGLWKAESDEEAIRAQNILGKILLGMNKHELNLYARIVLDSGKANQKTLLMFRQSNIAFGKALIIQPQGLNRILVSGGAPEDISAIRNCLSSRWPYPLTQDYEAAANDTNEDQAEKSPSAASYWVFKVKRYPWSVSYGNKHVDKLIESAKVLMANSGRNINFAVPNPGNMDSESAKSVLTFLLKDLSELGWRLQTAVDLISGRKNPVRPVALPERPSHAQAIVFLRWKITVLFCTVYLLNFGKIFSIP